jgi:hypothetical protein
MKAKLIKVEDVYRLLQDNGLDDFKLIIGTTDKEYQQAFADHCFQLSLKNCQAIECGYDLENMADFYGAKAKGSVDFKLGANQGFEAGFQKALELMGVKKFTEEDVRKAMDRVWDWCEDDKDKGCSSMTELRDKHIQSLQQNEWEVEIEMEIVPDFYSRSDQDGSIFTSNKKEIPKLDADGCLILKTIKN